jgi:hypothetical protein
MTEVTRILSAIQQGDPHAAAQLLPLVPDELRKLAAQRLAQEKPGQTLQTTALVHEAYLRLAGGDEPRWENRRHFFDVGTISLSPAAGNASQLTLKVPSRLAAVARRAR